MKTALRAFFTLLLVLLVVLFIEAPRVTRYLTSDGLLARIGSPYLTFASGVMGGFSRTTIITPPSTAEAPAKAVPKFEAPQPPYRVLMAGDSFMAERFGVQLERALEGYASTTVTRRGIYSTGLSRPDYFNWNTELNAQLAAANPNVAIIMFGANDAQDIRNLAGAITLHYGTPEWDAEYLARIRAFVAPLAEHKTMVFWIGNPVARDAYYRNRMEHLNALYAEALTSFPNARFVSTWDLLRGPDGNYAAYLPNSAGQLRLARTSDGIHVTDFGATFVVNSVLDRLRKELVLEPVVTTVVTP